MGLAFTWYFLILSYLSSFFALIFVFLLLRQFIKKKTLGTILLSVSFFFFAAGEVVTAWSETLYYFRGDSHLVGYLILFYTLFYSYGYIFFYYFANRHILRDKDFLRSIITVFLTAIVSILITMMAAEIMFDVTNPRFYQSFILAGVEIIIYLPQMLTGLSIYLPIFMLVHLRIIFRLVRIRGEVENPVAKKGFTYILASVILIVLSSLISSLYLMPEMHQIPTVVGLVHTFRALTATASIIVGYFGWILPDWLKQRIQGKAWIVQQMERRITAKIEPIVSSVSKENITEIAEK